MDSDHVETADLTEGRWRSDIQRLFASPTMLLQELPGLADLVRGYLAPDAPLRQSYADALLAAALAHGDMNEQPPTSPADRRAARERSARREGARGTLFLPMELDGVGEPTSAEDKRFVYGETGRQDTATEHRRWAGLRFGRADGRRGAMTPGTAAKWGTTFRADFEARLTSDMLLFLDDELAQQDFVDLVIPSKEQSRRYQATNDARPKVDGGQTAGTLNRLLMEQLAARVDEATATYPAHLTPTVLDSELTLSSFKRTSGDPESDRLYSSRLSRHGKPFEELVSTARRMVVLGNPGSGKSTVLAAAVARRSRAGSPAIMVRLSSVAPRLSDAMAAISAMEVLADVAAEELAVLMSRDQVAALVTRLMEDPDAFIALDGLDEVNADDLDEVWMLCRALESIAATVVISSRIAGYSSPPGEWQEFSVDNLAPANASAFLDAWFGGPDSPGRVRATAALATGGQDNLAEIPVLLGIVACVAEDSDDEVGSTEAELYDQYISLLLRGKWKPRDQWLDVEQLPSRLATARQLAWQMATGLTARVDGARWTDTIAFGDVIASATTANPDTARTLVERHGLFAAFGRNRSELHQRYRWLHRTIHEHLVGAYLAKRMTEDPSSGLLPDDLLMGPTQWRVPLLHTMALLGSDDQGRVMERLDTLRDEGDPGSVLNDLALALAKSLPPDSVLRSREAQRHSLTENSFDVHRLSFSTWRRELLTLSTKGALDVAAPHGPFDDQQLPPEHYVREVLRRLRAAPSKNLYLLALSIRWLSSYDADGALDAMMHAAKDPRFSPEFRWEGVAPSSEAASRAVSQISAWDDPEARLMYLYCLRRAGVPIRSYLKPGSALEDQDVVIADELADYHGAESTPEHPLPVWVLRTLLSGTYGVSFARGASYQDGADRIDRSDASPFLRLIEETDALLVVAVDEDPAADVEASIRVLDAMTVNGALDTDQLRNYVAAATSCVLGAHALSTDWCLQTYWLVNQVFERACEQDPRVNRHTSPLPTIATRFAHILAARPEAAREAVLASELEAWISPTRPSAFLELFGPLYGTSVLSVDDVVWLARWAAADDYVLLNTIDGYLLGSIAPEVYEKLWADAPEVVEISTNSIGRALAELGMLAPWRDRLITAQRAFKRRDRSEAATS